MARVVQNNNWISEEAAKCFYCIDAPCIKACPASINIPQFIRNLKFGNVHGAKEVIMSANCLGGTCGYLCPSEDLCESKCVRAKSGQAVQIRELQRYICNNGTDSKQVAAPFNGKKVAVIGAGPAGISCARELSMAGFQVDVFEKENAAGGTVRKEIPNFRIPEECIESDFRQLINSNINFHFNVEISADALKNKLMKEYDAIFLSIGLTEERDPHISYQPDKRIVSASDFLKAAKKGDLKVSGTVLVLGGGDTAMDAARSAMKNGADACQIIYRRSREEMPAGSEQMVAGIEDGVGVLYLTSCIAVTNGEKLTAELVRNELAEVEGANRKTFAEIKGSNFTIEADYIVFAFGKQANDAFRTVKDEKIFMGGDFGNGGKTIVDGVKEGKETAERIMEYLK